MNTSNFAALFTGPKKSSIRHHISIYIGFFG
jgi:hypothetical protein